ncbi:MAG: hypothetical protein WBR26_25070 [Candidatus Acidiferrum sp.]
MRRVRRGPKDQIVVLAAQRGIFLPTHDEKVEVSEGDRERAVADFKNILEQLKARGWHRCNRNPFRVAIQIGD